MKDFIFKLLTRILFYSFIFTWFYFATPALWDHGSSVALEVLFGFSVLIFAAIYAFEGAMLDAKKKQSK